MQIEFQKGIESQIRQERLDEIEKQQTEPLKLPSYMDIFHKKMKNKVYENLTFINDKELDEFQQVYIYPSKHLSNPSKQSGFDFYQDLDINLFVPARTVTIRDLIIYLQK